MATLYIASAGPFPIAALLPPGLTTRWLIARKFDPAVAQPEIGQMFSPGHRSLTFRPAIACLGRR